MKTSILALAIGISLAYPAAAYADGIPNIFAGLFQTSDHSHRARDERVELGMARPVQAPHNRRAELQPKCLRQLRLRWRRRRRRLEGGRRRLRHGGRNRWPLPPGLSWEFRVSPAPPASEALRGSPPWAFPPQTRGPGFIMAGASFSEHNAEYRLSPFCRLFGGNCEPRHSAVSRNTGQVFARPLAKRKAVLG